MRLIRNWYKLLEQSGLVANDDGPGAASGTLTANVARLPFFCPPEATVTVSGPLSPDATGEYRCCGIHNTYPYFFHSPYYLSSNTPVGPYWIISTTLGSSGSDGWERDYVTPLGEFTPYGSASGTATVSSKYTIPNGYKGVTIASSASRISSAAAAGFNSSTGSIEMLCRPTWNYNDGKYHYLWMTSGGAARYFHLRKINTNNTFLTTDATSRGSFLFPWQAHHLYHLVLNWGTNALYINKTLAYTFTPGDLGLGASTLYIGDHSSTPNYSFDGDILYFIVRDTPLTLAEITTFYDFFTKLYAPTPI